MKLAILILVSFCLVTGCKPQHRILTRAALNRDLDEIYKSTYKKVEVTTEASEQIHQLIYKADSVYEQSLNRDSSILIEKNFQLFCTTVLEFAEHSGGSKYKGMLLLSMTVVTTVSVQNAKFKLCPLWPFC